MKYILSFVGVGLIVLAICLCGGKNVTENDDYIRIHIVANSNSTYDQNLKYVVKDSVVEFLVPLLADAENENEAKEIISQNLLKINEVANVALRNEGASYSATVSITSEDMPTRAYDNLVLEEGVYDSLKIVLGEGDGDNWWCVVFPAVCYLDTKNVENVEYISKILDIISSVI